MSGFTDRENQLFDVLRTFSENDLEFIVFGGYAVSAFRHRFSVDVDLVIPADQFEQFASTLRSVGYEEIEDRPLERGRFVAFQKDDELPVTVDLMVDAVQNRETDATWGYEELAEHAQQAEIEGSDATVRVLIPEPELLVAMKLHSGRLTDARDVVALADQVDFERVEPYLVRGDSEALQTVLERVRDVVTSDDFADAFKGVFAAQALPETQIEAVTEFLDAQINQLAHSSSR